MTTPRLLGSRYELGETLGYGGMAEVHLGRDVRLGREVAVKVLRADLGRDPTFQTRFKREAQAAASLNHPAIVSVYDTGEDMSGPNGTTPYIVMEYVEGRTLRDILKNEGPLMPRRAMEIVADVCAALDFSHRNGIVHRDVKPGNVMITLTGAVKVMDFGIARAVADNSATVTQTAAVIGTAQYLSPEQARGEPVDARSDVYSTGCLLYELITGQPPFTGDSPVAVAYQHVRETAPPPSTLNPDVPPALDSIVMKSMAKNPANRYQSAADMRADLIRAIGGRPVAAEPVLVDEDRTTVLGGGGGYGPPTAYGGGYPTGYGTAVRPPTQPPRRRRTAGIIALALAVLLVFVLAAFLTARLLNGKNKNVSVPDLTNQTQSQAQQTLIQDGLKIGTVSTVASPAAQKDRVIRQSPLANTSVKQGGTVDLFVGGGPAQIQVPQLIGQDYNSAANQLSQQKLTPKRVDVNNPLPPGRVVGQTPAAGAQVPENATITLTVSTGNVAIPDVRGLTVPEATAKLNNAGFLNVAQQVLPPPMDYPAGLVFGTNPAAGSAAPTSSQITLEVAQAKPTASPTPPHPTTPAPTSSAPPTTTPPTTTAPPTTTPPHS